MRSICNLKNALGGGPAAAAMLLGIALCLGGCAQNSSGERRFFRPEYGLGTHGRKTWFDHLVEVDPGGITTQIAPDYLHDAPVRIAVLPFGDLGSANYIVNKVPLTHRNASERENWAWTDANRMRRSVHGYLSEREFLVANLIQVDSILREHGIDTEQKLEQVAPQTLGKWLGVDAVMYGNVTHYEAYYAFMLSAWQVGADVRMVSTHDGQQLFAAYGSRYSVNLQPAWDPIDIAINSVLGLLQLRDVVLARAEEEDAREIVLRIPHSPRLERELIEEATDGTIEYARVPAPAAAGN
ncbi:MAG TPA: GNA1162 family protein [Candidatus Binataceae bacterium]|nr:GNA1162 family protein [Candidatus Binataceae bacterium]